MILEWLLNYNASHPMPAEMPSLFSMIIVAFIVGGVAGFVVWLAGTIITRGAKFGGDVTFVFSLLIFALFTWTAFRIMTG